MLVLLQPYARREADGDSHRRGSRGFRLVGLGFLVARL